ncbi:MAG: beta-mannosidase, partial [Ruminococcus sp.]|nr:beta-mannosidase [Ruminococcus sp.]
MKYEAEDATLKVAKVSNDSSASGGKAVGKFEKNTETVTFNVTAANSGYYDITICSKGIG